MKIAVYAIAKNEEQFVQRWAKSCADADYRLILDTGSTDNTVSIAESLGISVFQKKFVPWRFDTARNYSLSIIPENIDYCIALDLDEILIDGWRDALCKIDKTTTRPRYKYVWSWNNDGSEGLVYGGDKIHRRNGYIWKHPVHEIIFPTGLEVQNWVDGLEIHHYPDSSKSRNQYFDLLKISVLEEPSNARNQFYLAREYFYKNQYDNALNHFDKFLQLSDWAPERAAAYRYIAIMQPFKTEHYLYKALAEDSSRRENWFSLLKFYYEQKKWEKVIACSKMLFSISEKPLDYLCDSDAWGWEPYDLTAIAYYYSKQYNDALLYGQIAASKNPTDERLLSNLTFYSSAKMN